MTIETAFISYQGGRRYNEDSVRCATGDSLCAAVVADGLGGHGGGKAASAITADFIADSFMLAPHIDEARIRHIFEQANIEVLKAQTPDLKMKSTAVALFIKDGAAVWAHAGDSRLYHFRDGVLIAQTLDHSVSQMAVFAGEITAEEIRRHTDRNKVLRAFGGGENIKAEVSRAQTLETGFHAFLLCTDGFWEYVWELEMELELAKSNTPGDWIRDMIQRLARRVPRDNDNFSVAALFINTQSEGE